MICKDEANATVAIVKGPVGGGYLPQSSQAAEYLAATKPAQRMGDRTQLYIDCMNVVKDFNRPAVDQTSSTRRYAGAAAGGTAAPRLGVGVGGQVAALPCQP